MLLRLVRWRSLHPWRILRAGRQGQLGLGLGATIIEPNTTPAIQPRLPKRTKRGLIKGYQELIWSSFLARGRGVYGSGGRGVVLGCEILKSCSKLRRRHQTSQGQLLDSQRGAENSGVASCVAAHLQSCVRQVRQLSNNPQATMSVTKTESWEPGAFCCVGLTTPPPVWVQSRAQGRLYDPISSLDCMLPSRPLKRPSSVPAMRSAIRAQRCRAGLREARTRPKQQG